LHFDFNCSNLAASDVAIKSYYIEKLTEILSWVGPDLMGKIAKIVIYGQARVNGCNNYEYPGVLS